MVYLRKLILAFYVSLLFANLTSGESSREESNADLCPEFDTDSSDENVCCPVPAQVANGSVSTPCGRGFGQEAFYACDPGYVLMGDPSRSCRLDGTWSGTDPVCRRDCGSLPEPANGDITLTGGTLHGATASFSCDLAFYMSAGTSNRTCGGDGSWSGENVVCSPVDCGGLSNPSFGVVSLTGTSFEHVANYSCNAGYQLIGIPTRICLSGASWSGSWPTCEPIDEVYCPMPAQVVNGSVSTPCGRGFGQEAVYACDPGYGLVGDPSRSCRLDGTWSGTDPVCRRDCGSLPEPANGDITLTGGTLHGATASFSCDLAFYMSAGTSNRTCGGDGSWSGENVVCSPVDCGNLSNPSFGIVSLTGTSFEHVANYSCNAGYQLIGSPTRICLSGASWSGSGPTCEPIDCGMPESPWNGSVTGTTTLGGMVTYSCDPGFVLTGGSATRTCTSSGWDGTKPCCEEVIFQECTDSRREFYQVCTNCMASASCGSPFVQVITVDIQTCFDVCLVNLGPDNCSMAESEWTSTGYTCKAYETCTTVDHRAPRTSVRKTCANDCLNITNLSKNFNALGTCPTIVVQANHTLDTCLSLCLDTSGCRAATHTTVNQTCSLHTCDTSILTGGVITFKLQCA